LVVGGGRTVSWCREERGDFVARGARESPGTWKGECKGSPILGGGRRGGRLGGMQSLQRRLGLVCDRTGKKKKKKKSKTLWTMSQRMLLKPQGRGPSIVVGEEGPIGSVGKSI